MITAFISADGKVTDTPFPPCVALTQIRLCWVAIQTGRETDRYVTTYTLVAVETLAQFGPTADSVLTLRTEPQIAEFTLPALLTKANVWVDAFSVEAVRPTDWHATIDASPSLVALAALTVEAVICGKALSEVIEAGSCQVGERLDSSVVQKESEFCRVARLVVDAVPGSVRTARQVRALVPSEATPVEVPTLDHLVVHYIKIWIFTAVLVDCLKVAHGPPNRLTGVKHFLDLLFSCGKISE